MKKCLTLLFVLIATVVYSQNEALFNRATTAYNDGDYEKAIEAYLRILENGEHSAALYYNLGNSHYKLDQIAPSIYYYEKALLLKPNDTEIKTNLAFAENMTLDAFEPVPETSLSRFYNQLIGFFTFDQWAYLAVGFLLLFVFAYIAFYYLRYSSQKRIAFITSIFAIILVVVSIVFAFLQYRNYQKDQPAIVFAEESAVKSEPNDRSSEIFVLHEGTKVNVLDQLEDYKKIELIDGKTGWILAKDVKSLKDF